MLRAEDHVRIQKEFGPIVLKSYEKKTAGSFRPFSFSVPLLGDELINDIADLLGRRRSG